MDLLKNGLSLIEKDGFRQIQMFPLDIIYSITIEAEHIEDCILLVHRHDVFLKLNKKLVQPGVWSFLIQMAFLYFCTILKILPKSDFMVPTLQKEVKYSIFSKQFPFWK